MIVALPFMIEGSGAVEAELVDVEVLLGEVELLVDTLVMVERPAGVVVETEVALELDGGVTLSGGITKIMKRAPTTSAIMSDATNEAVLSPPALFLLNESTREISFAFLLFCSASLSGLGDETLNLRRFGHSSRSHCHPRRCLSVHSRLPRLEMRFSPLEITCP